MDAISIKNKIKEILIDCLELTITPVEIVGTDLINELGINSVDAISIFISIEDNFQIVIEDENLSAALISSLDKITDFVESKI